MTDGVQMLASKVSPAFLHADFICAPGVLLSESSLFHDLIHGCKKLSTASASILLHLRKFRCSNTVS
jgi:hypothetical protein